MTLIHKIKNKILYIVSKAEWYDRFWGGATKFWRISRFDIDVINLGSNSGKYSFCYKATGINAMNWALGPQSLVHDFNILKNYFSYLNPNAFVIIVLCPFSSLVSSYTKDQNLKYYTFLHPATIMDFDEEERLRALRIKNNPLLEMPSFCIRQMIKSAITSVLHRKRAKCDFEADAQNFLDMWKRQFSIEDIDAPLSESHLSDQSNRISVLKDMIDFCKERDLRPVIVIPPMHGNLARKLTPVFRENYIYSFIRKANTAGVPFYDFMDDDRFGKDEFFRNSFFMNETGAEYFTGQFLKQLGMV